MGQGEEGEGGDDGDEELVEAEAQRPRPRSQTRPPPKSLTSSPSYKARKHIMQRKTGQMTRLSSCSGPSRSIVGARTSLHRSLTNMTGSRLLASFQAEMIHNANTNLIRIRSQPFRRAIGSSGKTRNWSGSFERMAPSSGVRLQIS